MTKNLFWLFSFKCAAMCVVFHYFLLHDFILRTKGEHSTTFHFYMHRHVGFGDFSMQRLKYIHFLHLPICNQTTRGQIIMAPILLRTILVALLQTHAAQ